MVADVRAWPADRARHSESEYRRGGRAATTLFASVLSLLTARMCVDASRGAQSAQGAVASDGGAADCGETCVGSLSTSTHTHVEDDDV